MEKNKRGKNKQGKPTLFGLLRAYAGMTMLLVLFTVLSNGLSLFIPKIIATGIDAYSKGQVVFTPLFVEFAFVSVLIFVFTYFQNVVQTIVSERVARDLREKLAQHISKQSYAYIQHVTPAKLLTNLTSDVDAVKLFVAQAVATIISSLLLIIGASVLLLVTNWRLALAVLTIVPIIGGTFYVVLGKVRQLFGKTQQIIDWLNKVINESILGAALIRVLHSQNYEYDKFEFANIQARDVGLQILSYFASMIPIITFVASLATLVILTLGGHFVINGTMSLGDFAAFTSYVTILIFPIIMIGFMSNVIARSSASYERILAVLAEKERTESGTRQERLHGHVAVKDVSLRFGERKALKKISFSVKPGTRTAIIGPTAAGKTQLLHVLTGLTIPDSGMVDYDGYAIDAYDKEVLHKQLGLVFQDSIIFNMTLRENIAFNETVTDEDLQRAIKTAELDDFIEALPKKLDTVVSERGASLSGGQKQRIMLARALALNPKILLLDDFTARVDVQTERKILDNVRTHYPGITLISVTQKIASVEDYEQIILLMEGEIVAKGTHTELKRTSPEYAQLYNSQRSTEHYEVRAE